MEGCVYVNLYIIYHFFQFKTVQWVTLKKKSYKLHDSTSAVNHKMQFEFQIGQNRVEQNYQLKCAKLVFNFLSSHKGPLDTGTAVLKKKSVTCLHAGKWASCYFWDEDFFFSVTWFACGLRRADTGTHKLTKKKKKEAWVPSV